MEEIKLIAPTTDYAEDIWAFRREILEKDADSEDQFAGCMSLDQGRLTLSFKLCNNGD